MKRYAILLLMVLLVSLTTAYAENLEFSIEPIRDKIDAEESAQFLVTITNGNNYIEELRIVSPDVSWHIPAEVIKAYPETDTEYKLVMNPTKYVDLGIKGIKLNFKNSSGDIIYSEIVQVNVNSVSDAVSDYRPSIRMIVDLPTNINPREKASIKVKLENQNILELPNLVLKVSSELESFETEQNIELAALGKKIVELNYELDPLQTPGDYQMTFELLKEGEVLESKKRTAKISSVSSDFAEEETKSGILFKSITTKTMTSSANVEETQTIKIPTNSIRSWFTSTEPGYEKVTEDDKKYLAIDLTLKPGESKDVVITVSYRWLALFILLVLILFFFHYRYKSPLTIRKGISNVNMKEGGISELKVTLELINNAKKTIKDITITDYAPNISDIQKDFGEGTLKPTKMFRHRTKGTILKWELEELAPGEERLIRYNLRSKLSVVGDFKLPRAKTKFKEKKKEFASYSNQPGVST